MFSIHRNYIQIDLKTHPPLTSVYKDSPSPTSHPTLPTMTQLSLPKWVPIVRDGRTLFYSPLHTRLQSRTQSSWGPPLSWKLLTRLHKRLLHFEARGVWTRDVVSYCRGMERLSVTSVDGNLPSTAEYVTGRVNVGPTWFPVSYKDS